MPALSYEEKAVSNEAEIEKSIQEKNLNAPRLTPADIDAVIVGESFTTLSSGKTMICELTLRNGYTVRGQSSVVSVENFDVEIGKNISREDARRKVWPLEGYLLQQRIFESMGSGSWLGRLERERDELKVRVDILAPLLQRERPSHISPVQWGLLRSQSAYMEGYLDALNQRIELARGGEA